MLVFFRSFFSSLVLELRGLSGTSDTDRRGRILDLRAGLGEDSVRWSLRPSLSCGSDGYVTKVALFIDAGDPASPLSALQRPDAEAGRKKDEIYDYEGRIWRSNMQAGRRFLRITRTTESGMLYRRFFAFRYAPCGYLSACLLSENLGQY